jgi:hypothetical protein
MLLLLWSTLLGWLRGVFAQPVPQKSREQSPEKRREVEPRREFHLLRAAERDAIVASHLNPRLQPLSSVQVAPRRWVDGKLDKLLQHVAPVENGSSQS